MFNNEVGKHCIQRVPPTERNGRKQTSIVTVSVMPLPPENTLKALPDHELEIKCQTGNKKAGGRNVNCVNSGVRMKHIPTGLSVFINGRDQWQNKREALRILTTKVHELLFGNALSDYNEVRKCQRNGGGRGEKIRTYNVLESRVVDHRTGKKLRDVDLILRKGRFDLLCGN